MGMGVDKNMLGRLEDIQQEMLDLLEEARGIVADAADEMTYNRAKSYWIAHVTTALTNEHGYLGGSMFTMQNTIDALRNEAFDVYACPGCGCMPGDGRTPGCTHPDGCGAFR